MTQENEDTLGVLLAPIVRGAMAEPTGNEDNPWRGLAVELLAGPGLSDWLNKPDIDHPPAGVPSDGRGLLMEPPTSKDEEALAAWRDELLQAKSEVIEWVAVKNTAIIAKSSGSPGDFPEPLNDKVAFVTGAAGAIGYGICEGLLKQGCLVAAGDLDLERLTDQFKQFMATYPGRVMTLKVDVTQSDSMHGAITSIVQQWGGLDIAIVNAGIAHVASLQELDLETFQRLQRVNVDGTLLTIAETSRIMRRQATGGDIILISTKNVFAPGARFGAYSATKAGAHQLARIASLELAEFGIRVNMVSPDAVFSHGATRSGLWATVGPDRMKARGLDEAGLEDYYRSRNLLKARVGAEHVARAVLFFVTHQTPTTGATIPVDGGLPDATPR